MDPISRKALLQIAREAIEAALGDRPSALASDSAFASGAYSGAFVSLHNGPQLRGCVGRLECEGRPLADLVRSLAVSALRDPRFSSRPVTLREMADILIELSLLSTLRPTHNPLELEPGVHGVCIRRGGQTGCFLPQVATHMRWNGEQMLSRCCCDKAGLPADAWRDPETEVFLFTAEVFSE